MTAQTLNNILMHVFSGHNFNQTISSYFNQKDEAEEFRQFMIVEVHGVPYELLLQLYSNDELKNYYAAMVKNQIKSKSSRWSKLRDPGYQLTDFDLSNFDDKFDEPTEFMVSNQKKKQKVIEAINYLQGKNPKLMEDFEHFKWFYFDSKSYRQIERMLKEKGTPISRHTVRTKVIRAEALIKNYIKNNYYDDTDI